MSGQNADLVGHGLVRSVLANNQTSLLNADVDVTAGELLLHVDNFGDHLNDRVAGLPLHIQILPQQRNIDLRLRRVLASL